MRLGIIGLLLHVTLAAQTSALEEYAYSVGVQAYIYAYPLVLMDTTQRVSLSRGVPVNHFAHIVNLSTPASRVVVYPNVDTLYSSAWLDLTKGPQTLHVPEMHGRYYTMQFMDAYSDNFAYVGTRSNGGHARGYAIIPPRWNGSIPAGVERIQAPTDTVWLLGRIVASEGDDLDKARPLQRQCTLNGSADAPLAPAALRSIDPPPKQVAAMNAQAFFSAMARLMKINRPHASDRALADQFIRIGVRPGEDFDIERLDPAVRRGLARAMTAARAIIESKIGADATVRQGWQFQEIGKWGNDFLRRATFAWMALAGNDPEEAVYAGVFTDGEGRTLQGSRRYALHLASGQTPPVNAFWSVTMYDADRYLVENPIHRYAIRDRTPGLRYNPDGSLDIWIQREAPPGKESNWLPAAEGEFSVQMRMYLPKPEALDGRWQPPPILLAP
jgi:hypothetical protein